MVRGVGVGGNWGRGVGVRGVGGWVGRLGSRGLELGG